MSTNLCISASCGTIFWRGFLDHTAQIAPGWGTIGDAGGSNRGPFWGSHGQGKRPAPSPAPSCGTFCIHRTCELPASQALTGRSFSRILRLSCSDLGFITGSNLSRVCLGTGACLFLPFWEEKKSKNQPKQKKPQTLNKNPNTAPQAGA